MEHKHIFFETHRDIEHIVFHRRRKLCRKFRLRRKNYVFYVSMCFKKTCLCFHRKALYIPVLAMFLILIKYAVTRS